jgi:uncharacterized protein (TIGR00299 family) protein
LTKVTIIDCQTAGISGDMLLAALIDAGANIKLIQETLQLIPKHYPKCKSIQLETTEVRKHGFRARRAVSKISEDSTEVHAESMIEAIEKIATPSQMSAEAVAFARESVKTLVEVESRLHGVSLKETHLHEAGSTDTLADILGVATACDSLGIFDGKIYSTPVAVGGGTVNFSHGKLAVPAPAVLEILTRNRVPVIGGPEPTELATPTGVSMLVNLVDTFLEQYPPIVPERTGYGAGSLDLPTAPNMLRVVIGQSLEHNLNRDSVQVLETNLDDLPGEMLGHAIQRILDSGARDVWVTSAQFKKNRPGHILQAICDPQDAERIAELIMEETGTLGVRYQEYTRFTLNREIRTIKVRIQEKTFAVRIKTATTASGRVIKTKPEFDDIHTIAETLAIPARTVAELITQEAQKQIERKTGETRPLA